MQCFLSFTIDSQRAISIIWLQFKHVCPNSSFSRIWSSTSTALAESYDVDTSSLSMECSLAKHTLIALKVLVMSWLNFIRIKRHYQSSHVWMLVLFSSLKRITTYLWSTSWSIPKLILLYCLLRGICLKSYLRTRMDTTEDKFAAKARNRRITSTKLIAGM